MLKIAAIPQLTQRKRDYSDVAVVEGLQTRNTRMEEWFYKTSKAYFDEHFNDVFFDKDRKQEIFQMAFLKLWTEIHNGKITVRGEEVCRQQRSGEYLPMTCRLTSFLMTFAKTEYRELVRSNRLDTYAEVYDNVDTSDMVVTTFDKEEDIEAHKNRIVDDCISELPPRCTDVLTLFYYEGKSLDEILEIRSDRNTSKNGLKTAKNKCMNTLRERILSEFRRFNYKV